MKLNKNIVLEYEASLQPKKTCKGLIYKLVINNYLSPRYEIVSKTIFKPVKRLSCPGCTSCYGLEEALNEYIVGYDLMPSCDSYDHNQLYRLVVHPHTDYETGIVDDFDLEFIKYKEAEE